MSTNTARLHGATDSLRRLQMINDAEWSVLEPSIPSPPRRGRPWKWTVRQLFEAVLFVLVSGCHWRLLPPNFPPKSTVHRHFRAWSDMGLFERLNHRLVMLDREREGREASPTAAIVDSKTVRGGVTGRISGYDGAKKLKGLKWHLMVDVGGRLLAFCLSAADRHDSRAAVPMLKASRRAWPFVEKVWADAAYRGKHVGAATPIVVEVVTGPPNQKGFIVQKRRWVVERTFSWIERNRRLLLNHEKLASSVMAYVVLAAAMVLVRRVAA